MDLGYQVNACARAFKHQLTNALVPADLTAAQYVVLKCIQSFAINEHSVTAAQVGKILDFDKPTLSGIAKRLEAKGLLKKEKHPKDQRAFLLFLTEEGSNRIQDLDFISASLVNRAVKGLSEEEINILSMSLNKLLVNLNEGEHQNE